MPNTILTIGADPEFCTINPLNRSLVPAQNLINSSSGEFGLDGNPSTFELRPKPATNPLELVENIYKLFDTYKREYSSVFQMDMLATSNQLPLGGHIHFGHPSVSNSALRRGETVERISKNLDLLLAFPMATLEDPQDRRYRIGRYGKLSDVRTDKSYGFEYRTLPSWISSRKLAEAVCAIAYGIADASINQAFTASWAKMFPYNDLRMVFEQAPGILPVFWERIRGELLTLDTLKPYQKQLQYFNDSVKAGKPLTTTEIKDGWMIEFVRLADLKLSNLKSLIERLADAIVLASATNVDEGHAEFRLFSPGNDYRVRIISENINIALSNIVGSEILQALNVKPSTLFGVKESTGNVIKLSIDTKVEIEQLKLIIRELCKRFGYDEPTFEINSQSESKQFALGLPRKMRGLNNYLSEAVAVVTWLYINREAYKSTTKTKRGVTVKLPFGVNNVVGPLSIKLSQLTRHKTFNINEFSNDSNGFDKPQFIAWLKQNISDRLATALLTGHTLSLTSSIFNAINEHLHPSRDFDSVRIDGVDRLTHEEVVTKLRNLPDDPFIDVLFSRIENRRGL